MKINQKAINTLRVLSAEMIADAKAGGDTKVCYNASPSLYTLFKDYYNFLGGEDNINRDRFVLADNSATALYYVLLHIFGFQISIEDLKNFSSHDGKTPISPILKTTDGVEVSIDGKGQGIATAVGLAIAEQSLSEKFNVQKFNIISNYTYCFTTNKSLEEGISQEAMSMAGKLKLSHLIVLYSCDSEKLSESVKDKYKAMGWNVFTSINSNSYFWNKLVMARAKLSTKPSIIIFKNKIAQDNDKESTIKSKILKSYEVEKLKADLGFNGSYNISNDVKQLCMRTNRKLKVEYLKWERKAVLYKNTHPKLSEELNEYYVKPKIQFAKFLKTKLAETSELDYANKLTIDFICNSRPCLMLASTNKKFLLEQKNQENLFFSKTNYRGKTIIFGNRENAMTEIVNGMSLYYLAPTYCFAPYTMAGNMVKGIERSVKMELPTMFTFYEKSILVQKNSLCFENFEQRTILNSLNDLQIFRPADINELIACHNVIYDTEKTSCLMLSEGAYPVENTSFDEAKKGAYVVSREEKSDIIFVASGAELGLALKLKTVLGKQTKCSVVSMPSYEIFKNQSEKYKQTILPQNAKLIFLDELDNNIWNNRFKNSTYINLKDYKTIKNTNEEIDLPKLSKTIKQI